ncbi:MAG: hypothetical protein WD066_13765 [Planctomycetaceae bacterium]
MDSSQRVGGQWTVIALAVCCFLAAYLSGYFLVGERRTEWAKGWDPVTDEMIGVQVEVREFPSRKWRILFKPLRVLESMAFDIRA